MSEMLRPLQMIDIPKIYAQQALLVDFVLYLVLFNGIAQVALVKRLEGKGGRLVAGAVGTALALAMTGLEASTGFTVASMGPLAAALLLALVGITVFRLLRHLGVSGMTAGAFTVVLVVLGIESTAPCFADAVAATFPFLDLAVALSLLVLAWKAFHHLIPRGPGGKLQELAEKVEAPGSGGRPTPAAASGVRREAEVQHLRRELRLEKPEIGRHLKKLTKKERKSCKEVRRELAFILSLLQRGKHSEADRKAIAEALRRIPPERQQLSELVAAVKALDGQLARFDLGVLRELRTAWERIPPAQRPVMRRLALEERAKLDSEQRIAAIEGFVTTYDQQGAQLLEKAVQAIVQNAIPDAIALVQAAERNEAEAVKKVEEILELERLLRRIMRLELRQTRRAA